MKINVIKNKKGFMLKQALLGIFDAMIVVGFGFLGALFFLFTTVPSGDLKNDWKPAQTTTIYDKSGNHILYELYGEENRKIVEHSYISENIRKATIAAEDDSFYKHNGFDIKSIVRAFQVNLRNDQISQGGSTITQQLARSIYLSNEKTIKRKVKEILIAVKMERKINKDDILDYYLNTVPYGANAYGVESASRIFFGKNAKDLSLAESALLASLPKAPTYYSPYGTNKDELMIRQKLIIERIAELGLVTREEAENAKNENVAEKILDYKSKIEAPHFVFHVIGELEEKYSKDELEVKGLKVITTLDYELQKVAEKVILNGVDGVVSRYGGSNAALVALEPSTGGILAMVGSKDYFDDTADGQVNVTTRLRQPGSSIKPIIYAAAFEKGYQPETRITDSQTNFGPDGSGRDYIPRNYSGDYKGNISMRQALSMSLNIPAVKTLNSIGIDSAINMAEKLGIKTFTDRNRYGLSLAIGGAEVTLLQETAAYSVFANDGIRQKASAIQKISSAEGEVIFSKDSINGERVIEAEVARKINSILSDNEARTPVFGPNSSVFIPGKVVAAKTGTTQEYKDAWTVGYTPALAVGIWTGNNDSRPMKGGADGSVVAAPIWKDFMTKALPEIDKGATFVAYTPVSKELLKHVDKPNSNKDEKISKLASSNVKYKENLIKDKRPSGWSKREWDKYKKSLGL